MREEGSNRYDKFNERFDLIKKSKLVLLCLEAGTQRDESVILELGNNRGFKHPRPVIPLFLEARNASFPNNEIKAHCFMTLDDTVVFDISNCISNNSDAVKASSDSIVGIDPIDLELNTMINYIRFKIDQLYCV